MQPDDDILVGFLVEAEEVKESIKENKMAKIEIDKTLKTHKMAKTDEEVKDIKCFKPEEKRSFRLNICLQTAFSAKGAKIGTSCSYELNSWFVATSCGSELNSWFVATSCGDELKSWFVATSCGDELNSWFVASSCGDKHIKWLKLMKKSKI